MSVWGLAKLMLAGRIPATVGACCALLAACAASSSFQNGVFRGEYTSYRVGVLGSGWRRVSVDDNDLAFFNKGQGTIGANSTCTDYDDVPKPALMNHLLFGTSDRVYRVEEEVTLDGRGARHVIVDAELDGAPITLEIFLLVKDGCVYDLTLTTARDTHARAQPDFHRFVSAFEVLAHD